MLKITNIYQLQISDFCFLESHNIAANTWIMSGTHCRKFEIFSKLTDHSRVRQPKEGRQRIIWPIFPENCMKIKKFGSGGGGAHARTPLNKVTGRGCLIKQLKYQF